MRALGTRRARQLLHYGAMRGTLQTRRGRRRGHLRPDRRRGADRSLSRPFIDQPAIFGKGIRPSSQRVMVLRLMPNSSATSRCVRPSRSRAALNSVRVTHAQRSAWARRPQGEAPRGRTRRHDTRATQSAFRARMHRPVCDADRPAPYGKRFGRSAPSPARDAAPGTCPPRWQRPGCGPALRASPGAVAHDRRPARHHTRPALPARRARCRPRHARPPERRAKRRQRAATGAGCASAKSDRAPLEHRASEGMRAVSPPSIRADRRGRAVAVPGERPSCEAGLARRSSRQAPPLSTRPPYRAYCAY